MIAATAPTTCCRVVDTISKVKPNYIVRVAYGWLQLDCKRTGRLVWHEFILGLGNLLVINAFLHDQTQLSRWCIHWLALLHYLDSHRDQLRGQKYYF